MNYLFFVLLFLFFANWITVKLLLVKLLVSKQTVKPLTDVTVRALLQKHFKFAFTMKLVHSDRIFGMATGIPTKAYIFLSQGVFTHLTETEREWIILHEGGHVKLYHPILTCIFQAGCLFAGCFTLFLFNLSIASIFLITLLICIFYYQINRIFIELKADEFAVSHMKDPAGMISANKIMKQRVTSVFYKKPFLTYLFTPHPTYDDRMRMAEREIERRNM